MQNVWGKGGVNHSPDCTVQNAGQKENTQRRDNTDGNCTFKVMPEILAGWGD